MRIKRSLLSIFIVTTLQPTFKKYQSFTFLMKNPFGLTSSHQQLTPTCQNQLPGNPAELTHKTRRVKKKKEKEMDLEIVELDVGPDLLDGVRTRGLRSTQEGLELWRDWTHLL